MWKSRIRVLQLFSAAVVDQVLLSGANFLVGFLLIRNTGDSDYATFVLVQSAILLVITAQSAWLSGPLAIIAPKRPADSRRVMVGAVEHAQRRFLRRVVLIALCVPAAGYLGGIWDAFSAAVLAIGVFAAWMALQRELVRRILLIYSRANTLLGVDAIYVVIFVGGTFAAIHVSHQAVIWAVTGLALAGWSGAAAAHRSLAKDPGWTKEGDSAPILRELRRLGVWSTVGALTYWLFSQSYNYLLVSRLDLKAVADVNAARLVIMPAIVFTVGMESLLIPKSAGWLASIGLHRLLKRLTVLFLGIALLEIGYFLVIWVFRDWVSHDLLHKDIHDRDRLLLLWAIIALIGLLRTVFQSALVALEPLRLMAAITGVGAVISLTLMWFGMGWWGAAGVLFGQVAGDLAVIIGYALVLHGAWRRA